MIAIFVFTLLIVKSFIAFTFLANAIQEPLSTDSGIITELDIPDDYSVARAGDSIKLGIRILQPNYKITRDLIVKYYIKNKEIISAGEQTIALQTQASLIGELTIPSDAKSGMHSIIAEVRLPNEDRILSRASKQLFVKENSFLEEVQLNKINTISLYIVLIALVIWGIIVQRQNRILKKIIRKEGKVNFKDIRRYARIREKLENSAYHSMR